ncbi:MAG: hypothetical protein AAF975_02415 [Spirochaetota bacterium]
MKTHLHSLYFWQKCLSVAILFFVAGRLPAQAPTDEWRRGGVDPMVAEPGQAASILINPAGMKSKEQRKAKADIRPAKEDYITEILSLGMFVDIDILGLLRKPEQFNTLLEKELKDVADRVKKRLESFTTNADGKLKMNTNDLDFTLKVLQGLKAETYRKLVNGTKFLSAKTPDTVLKTDLQREGAQGNLDQVNQNLKAINDTIQAEAEEAAKKAARQAAVELAENLAQVVGKNILKSFGKSGLEWYSRLFGLSYSDDSNRIAWGMYFGFEQTLAIRINAEKSSMPLEVSLSGAALKIPVPIALKFYLLTPWRLAFATDWEEALPGFTFGLGLKVVPYNGFNHRSLGYYLSQGFGTRGLSLGTKFLAASFYGASGLNLGLDFGVQYHFGAITPKWDFLHLGLKVSDLAGFNFSWNSQADALRYALDFDLGFYAEKTVSPELQLFGGAELLQMRGMFFDASPFSALYEPIDHLRVLLGIGLLDNLLRFSLQYYNSNLTLGLMFHLGVFQLGMGVNVNTVLDRAGGLDLTLRFRSPRDGFNRHDPYRRYGSRDSAVKNMRD